MVEGTLMPSPNKNESIIINDWDSLAFIAYGKSYLLRNCECRRLVMINLLTLIVHLYESVIYGKFVTVYDA